MINQFISVSIFAKYLHRKYLLENYSGKGMFIAKTGLKWFANLCIDYVKINELRCTYWGIALTLIG